MHFDAIIGQTSREVKFWSILLIFLSALTLFNNLTIASSGKLGDGWLDSSVTVVDTLCSAFGLWVGRMGLTSGSTLNLTDIQTYFHYLTLLAIACVCMRIAWVIDVVVHVQRVVADSHHKSPNESGSTHLPTLAPSSSNDDMAGKGSTGKLDDRVVFTYALQASLIAAICVYAWYNCWLRAMRLRNAVQSYTTNPIVAGVAANNQV
mmetsp:Transcript_20292/g.27933  ORF Transcript_20292/g.27933 Transcript_20292/m.27933 type:complete len:206 (+) Transcript_20292:511-1128(+)